MKLDQKKLRFQAMPAPFKKIHGFEDKILFDSKWLQLREVDNYVYSHEIRCNGMIVLILPYRRIGKDGWEFLIREETTPCWSPLPTLSAMTGGVENPENPVDDAARELFEESGYSVSAEALVFLGKCRASKSSDTYYHLYTVDLAGIEPEEAGGGGDGTENDVAPLKWVTDLSNLEDAQALAAYVKLRKLGVY